MAKRSKPTKQGVKPPRVPAYCLHKGSVQAYVKVRGQVIYLGSYGSAASRDAYAQVVADVLAGRPVSRISQRHRSASNAPADSPCLTVRDVCTRFATYAQSYYVKNGKPTPEVGIITAACDHAAQLVGDQPAERFGPLSLKAVRDKLIAKGLARSTVNGSIRRIRRAFKWAAGEELIPATVHVALATVEGLRAGRSEARETDPVLPVDIATIEATLPHLPEVVADMVRLQRLTGMRPGEVCSLRPGDLDRSGEVWTYRPADHKTQHHGRDRVIFIGPQAQGILLRYLARDAGACCFQPCDSESKRRAAMHAMRVTPLSCGDVPGSNVKSRPERTPGECYSTDSYRRAITRACKAAIKAGADIEPWSPNRLRHTAATEVRKRFGLEAAQTILGHSTAKMTEVYAEKDLQAGVEVARAMG